MRWIANQIKLLHPFVARSEILALIVVATLVGYFGGLLYWYGGYIVQTQPPMWVWLFIPDCPLFAFWGGLALLGVVARRYWSRNAQMQGQRALMIAGVVMLVGWLSTYLPSAPAGWVNQQAMLGIACWTFLLFGFLFRRLPLWLLTITVFGNIKYGVWTVSAWLIFWRNTALVLGAPYFSADSILMTITHLGMIGLGIFLITWFRPNWTAALIAFVWFGLSDFVDYGLGYYPPLPELYIPVHWMQWSTIVMTLLLTVWLLWLSQQPAVQDEKFPAAAATA
ncbi:MAG: DUF1405 domain-containing protein [Caldilineaceae bacterium]|nr:DUF1405 domain-containing protein [Caldilineaceae bacterium]